MTRLLAFTVLALAATSLALAQTRPPIAEQISKTYGLDSWNQIEAIRYTWNAQLPGVNLAHTWEWHPKTGQVTFDGKGSDGKPVNVSYVQSQIDSAPANVKDQVNPSFVNDQYWLLLPLHLTWDTSANVTDDGMKKLPIGKGSATLVVMKYPPEAGGFTPGDTWDLYLGANGRIEAMTYHRGGPKKPSLVTVSWAGYKKAGPLLISTEHPGTADGKPFRVFFTDVAVKLTGSDAWVKAE
jgi:hypothetical protein